MKLMNIIMGGVATVAITATAYAQDSTVAEPAVVIETPTPATASPDGSGPALVPATGADGCELHIWPAERMASQTSGLLGPGLLSSAINGKRDSTNQSLMATALDSQNQLNALTALDLRDLLVRTDGTTIVLHETPLERKTMNKVKTRRSDSTASCYAELIVADVFYQKSMMYGRSLRTLFMVRVFGDDQKIDKEYKAWGGNGLSLFPPKEGEDAIAALDELSAVFKANFLEYARNARATLTGKAKR